MRVRPPIVILLVEDDVVDVMDVRRAFDKARIADSLHVASDGVDALARLRDEAWPCERSLVLLDLNLPKMNGLELLRALRADAALRHLPVVVLTTSDEERDRAAAQGLDVDGYLVKPLRLESFVELVAAIGARWRDVAP